MVGFRGVLTDKVGFPLPRFRWLRRAQQRSYKVRTPSRETRQLGRAELQQAERAGEIFEFELVIEISPSASMLATGYAPADRLPTLR